VPNNKLWCRPPQNDDLCTLFFYSKLALMGEGRNPGSSELLDSGLHRHDDKKTFVSQH
jgi:hypothetical protein